MTDDHYLSLKAGGRGDIKLHSLVREVLRGGWGAPVWLTWPSPSRAAVDKAGLPGG